ncbi:hypothetical protein PRZ48_005516 [Zasmidium cellare]|uniref:nitrilase n=1 Tax=Zasmidium cellare TaxID=395010 RepID=A0ABR0EU13_ZASCE|nr:hypothetical protein PRZ48_005516 [Zasmidium cellare]
MTTRKWKAAVSQSEPCWLDKAAGVKKTISLIREAKSNGASLVAFAELWLPGYPIFLWSGTYIENINLVQQYIKNSLSAHGLEMLEIRRAAKDEEIYVALGFSEVDGGSLYMAQMLIGPEGDVLMHRKKIKPTHMERTMFGEGTGDSLRNVVDTPLGKIGMLNCWEHFQPLLKYHTFSQGEEVHIAAWPNNRMSTTLEPWSISMRASPVLASQMYAVEGQAWVLCTNSPVSEEGIERNTSEVQEKRWQREIGGGVAAVYGPDGGKMTLEIETTFDGLIYCEVDLDKVFETKALAESVGAYSWPDLRSMMSRRILLLKSSMGINHYMN